MGSRSKHLRLLVVLILLFVPLLVVSCNRSAPEAEELEQTEDTSAVEETTEQTMPTTEEATVTDPAVEEPAVEEPAVEEPAVEEPAVEEPAVEETAPEETTPDTERPYIILPGDTLFSIAQSYGITVEEIAARNGILNVHSIDVGQQIIIPVAGADESMEEMPATGERVHTVRAGENLFRISLAHNMSFETVAAYNNVPWPYQIYPGQQIKIPATE